MKATVVRAGAETSILAREIVPGDIVIIEEGEVIPCDASLICNYDVCFFLETASLITN